VLPCVWHGSICSLIRSTLGKCLARLCREELFVSPVNRKVQRGPSVKNLSNVIGTVCWNPKQCEGGSSVMNP
jgi:hypothetical protein